MKRILIIVLAVFFLLAGCGASEKPALVEPFAHTYRIEEVLHSSDPALLPEETTLIEISAFGDLWIMEDLTTYEFQDVGQFKKSDLAEDDPRKGLWTTVQVEGSDIQYQLSVEADDSVRLMCMEAEQVQWAYKLSRVDTITANVATTGERSHMEIDWYFADTFPGDLQQLSSGKIYNKGTLGFYVEDERITSLTVFEEYYTDGNVEYKEYTLNREDGFNISVNTRYETGKQYAIYRIPFENGEYLFSINYW